MVTIRLLQMVRSLYLLNGVWRSLKPDDDTIPAAPASVILYISKLIHPTRNHLHFGVKAFGDAAAFAKTQHGNNRL